MKKSILAATVFMGICALSTASFSAENSGEALFNGKCASCHPKGGNIIKPSETLKGIKNANKITSKIRKGGGGMPIFDAKAVSDADAKLLADYIMKTFKK
ncbi:MAG: c-type cytochrome [Desulfuromonadaceae bacterium]|nr:c-type cytochrome [Desulfuromonadaceae bacterium]MDD5106349.1 c-type cytochrome [Desulfuromonadaceae bacterium]